MLLKSVHYECKHLKRANLRRGGRQPRLESLSHLAENLVDIAHLFRKRMPENLREIHPQTAAETLTFPNRKHPACASSTLSETTSKLSCFFLDVFDESRDVQSVGQRMMEIDEER